MVEGSGDTSKEQPQIWEYEKYFREYMLLLGKKGAIALETINNYPKRIQLNTTWHEALERMRSETKGDGHERHAVVGFRESERDFYFPQVPAKGERHRIPSEIVGDTFWQAWKEYGITHFVGTIYTHPSGSPFSPTDLYGLLNRLTEPQLLVSGLATDQKNLFAFRTKETSTVSELDTPIKRFSRVFKDYWIENTGYKHSNNLPHLVKTEPSASLWKANVGIAEAHRLALYSGNPKEDLTRVYP